MAAERELRERDILVAANEYAYVQDLTKGDIVLYVGPTKISLSNTERLVEFRGGRFAALRGEESGQGVSPFIVASSSQYILLENPPRDPHVKPVKGNNSAIELVVGKKVVVPGPATFPLWPGQRAEVIDGHELREDQYLVVRVYDRVEAENEPIGTQRIVKGSEVSFYIPKTGLEVVPDEKGYVRSAVTLLEGEYCVLLAPNGQTRFVRGPAVVVPGPMEEFVRKGSTKIFKAVQLRKNMGLRVRVIRDFAAQDGQVPPGTYRAGQEIFIREREGFFFPSESVESVSEVQSIPIGEREGVYVRDFESGEVSTELGPKNYLPDPTRVEVVNRVLDPEVEKLYGVAGRDKGKAVSIYVPPGFAVMVTGKKRREVVEGPATRVLHFDEDLEALKLSTGKPKTDETLLTTCFLQITGNKVSDIVRVKTADHVELEVALSYRVTFGTEGERARERWFDVKNYVALLCDHLGSIVRAAVQATPIEVFHTRSAEVIRAAVLGEKKGDEKRAGRRFAENGMAVYDLEVLDVKILDADVKKLLTDAQRNAIVSEVEKKQERLRLGNEEVKQDVERRICEAQMGSIGKAIELQGAKRTLAEARVKETIELDRLDKAGRAQNQAEALDISSAAAAAAAERESQVDLKDLQARVQAFKDQMGAMHPELVATLKVIGDQELSKELARSMSPLAILGGNTVAEVAERLLKALPVGLALRNGGGEPAPRVRKKAVE